MFSEKTLLVSDNLLLGLINDLLFALSSSEIVQRLPAKAMNAAHGYTHPESSTVSDRAAPS